MQASSKPSSDLRSARRLAYHQASCLACLSDHLLARPDPAAAGSAHAHLLLLCVRHTRLCFVPGAVRIM
jgi:hypothetical protein